MAWTSREGNCFAVTIGDPYDTAEAAQAACAADPNCFAYSQHDEAGGTKYKLKQGCCTKTPKPSWCKDNCDIPYAEQEDLAFGNGRTCNLTQNVAKTWFKPYAAPAAPAPDVPAPFVATVTDETLDTLGYGKCHVFLAHQETGATSSAMGLRNALEAIAAPVYKQFNIDRQSTATRTADVLARMEAVKATQYGLRQAADTVVRTDRKYAAHIANQPGWYLSWEKSDVGQRNIWKQPAGKTPMFFQFQPQE